MVGVGGDTSKVVAGRVGGGFVLLENPEHVCKYTDTTYRDQVFSVENGMRLPGVTLEGSYYRLQYIQYSALVCRPPLHILSFHPLPYLGISRRNTTTYSSHKLAAFAYFPCNVPQPVTLPQKQVPTTYA